MPGPIVRGDDGLEYELTENGAVPYNPSTQGTSGYSYQAGPNDGREGTLLSTNGGMNQASKIGPESFNSFGEYVNALAQAGAPDPRGTAIAQLLPDQFFRAGEAFGSTAGDRDKVLNDIAQKGGISVDEVINRTFPILKNNWNGDAFSTGWGAGFAPTEHVANQLATWAGIAPIYNNQQVQNQQTAINQFANDPKNGDPDAYSFTLTPAMGIAAVLSGGLAAGALGGAAAGAGALGGVEGSAALGGSLTGGALSGAGAGAGSLSGLGAAGAFDAGGLGAAESMGLGAGYTSPAAVTGAGAGMDVGAYNPADPFGLNAAPTTPTPGVDYGSLSGVNPGDFTASQLPGGSLSGYGGAGGMVDLGGAGAIPGVDATAATGTESVLSKLTAKIGEAAAKTVLGRMSNGTATDDDYAKLLGVLGSTALGVIGSTNQSNTLKEIADQSRNDRLPYLNKSMEWLNNPQAYTDGPGKAGLDATLRALSVQGNPFGNATSLALAGDIANKNWQNAVTGFGNLGLAGQDTRSQLLSNAATADRGVTSSLSSGLGSLTAPDNTLEDLLRKLNSGTSNNSLT